MGDGAGSGNRPMGERRGNCGGKKPIERACQDCIAMLCCFCKSRNDRTNENERKLMTPLEPATNNAVVWTYLTYLFISVALTVWVARTLHKNGRIFLVDSFLGNEPLADSVNHLLVVGFYLINIGFVTLALKYGDKAVDTASCLEILSTKVGLVLVVLGVMHFFNLFVFSKMRRRVTQKVPPPLPPPAWSKAV